MPEGPEVCLVATQLHNRVSGWEITDVLFIGGRYSEENPPLGYQEFQEANEVVISEVGFKGKFIYFVVDYHIIHGRKEKDQEYGTWYIGNTLGMSGGWGFSKKKHSNFAFVLSSQEGNKTILYFTDTRHFGTIRFFVDGLHFENKMKELGESFIPCRGEHTLTLQNFVNNAKNPRRRKVKIASFLMNQKAVAGIGNYILAETLYRSKINPWRTMVSLSDEDLEDIYNSAMSIMTESLSKKGVSIQHFQDTFDSDGQYQLSLHAYNRCKDKFGNDIKKTKGPHGRTIHWCPKLQGEKP